MGTQDKFDLDKNRRLMKIAEDEYKKFIPPQVQNSFLHQRKVLEQLLEDGYDICQKVEVPQRTQLRKANLAKTNHTSLPLLEQHPEEDKDKLETSMECPDKPAIQEQEQQIQIKVITGDQIASSEIASNYQNKQDAVYANQNAYVSRSASRTISRRRTIMSELSIKKGLEAHHQPSKVTWKQRLETKRMQNSRKLSEAQNSQIQSESDIKSVHKYDHSEFIGQLKKKLGRHKEFGVSDKNFLNLNKSQLSYYSNRQIKTIQESQQSEYEQTKRSVALRKPKGYYDNSYQQQNQSHYSPYSRNQTSKLVMPSSFTDIIDKCKDFEDMRVQGYATMNSNFIDKEADRSSDLIKAIDTCIAAQIEEDDDQLPSLDDAINQNEMQSAVIKDIFLDKNVLKKNKDETDQRIILMRNLKVGNKKMWRPTRLRVTKHLKEKMAFLNQQ